MGRSGRLLAEARRRLQHEQERLRELRRYLDEYRQRCGRGGTDIRRWQEDRLFLQRLDQAVARQAERVAEAEAACRREQEGWLQSRQREETLQHVSDRLRQAQREQDLRREQREADGRPHRPGRNGED